MRSGRIEALDALRGIAALVVVFHHSLLAFPGGAEGPGALPWLYLSPLRLLVDGTGAVVLFFILSGLVLADGAVRTPYADFVMRRICRIWLPFAAVIAAAVVLTSLVPVGTIPGFSGWFNEAWSRHESPAEIAKLLAMVGATDLDSPAWTLFHELRLSLVLPLLALLSLRSGRLTLAGTVALAILAVFAMNRYQHLPGVAVSLLMTVMFAPMFVLGLCLAKRLDQARRTLGSLGPMSRAYLWCLAAGGLVVVPTGTSGLSDGPTPLLLIVCAVAASLLLVLCISGKGAQFFLSGRAPRFLGRVSYSLYLIHVVVIEAVGRALHGLAGPVVAVPLAIALSIGLAHFSQRWIEVPATALGKRLGRFASDLLRPVGHVGVVLHRGSADAGKAQA